MEVLWRSDNVRMNKNESVSIRDKREREWKRERKKERQDARERKSNEKKNKDDITYIFKKWPLAYIKTCKNRATS